jgi:uncharacterized protein (TIGR01319 family)
LSRELTSKAVEVAVKRHAGCLISLYGSFGRNTYAQGKDLTKVQFIIGTGGALTRLPSGREILGAVISDRQKELLPRNAEILLDNSYLLASLGVLSLKHPQGALRLMQDTLGINR